MADLKKKFIDILFEEEGEEREFAEDNKANESVSPIKAKDILYRKSGSSAFINLNENKPVYTPSDIDRQDEYEMSSQISPIFGLIKENTKKVVNVNPEITDSQIKKPEDAHLDIITSPIYGYGNKEDAQKNNYDVKGIIDEDEEEELHHLFDEDNYLDKSYDTLDSTPQDEEEISLFRLFGENK